jgi:hypothetical protein
MELAGDMSRMRLFEARSLSPRKADFLMGGRRVPSAALTLLALLLLWRLNGGAAAAAAPPAAGFGEGAVTLAAGTCGGAAGLGTLSTVSELERSTRVSMAGGLGRRRNLDILSMASGSGL